jgi:hypothetical protein
LALKKVKTDKENPSKNCGLPAWEICCRGCKEHVLYYGKKSLKDTKTVKCKECSTVNIIPKILVIWPDGIQPEQEKPKDKDPDDDENDKDPDDEPEIEEA